MSLENFKHLWTPGRRKLAVVVVFTSLWIAIAFSRTRFECCETDLDPSWWEGLAALAQQGAISGRDFHFTYGPLGQFIAWLGTLGTTSHSAFASYGMITFVALATSALVIAIAMLLANRISYSKAIFVYICIVLLNLFSDLGSFRVALLVLCCVMAHRATASGKMSLAAAAGIVCFIAQLATPEVGVFGISTVLLVLILSRLNRSALVSLAAFLGANVVIGVYFRLSSSTYESLFAYQRYALATMVGYQNGMGLDWTADGWHTAALLTVICATVVCGIQVFRKRNIAESSLLTSLVIGSLFSLRSAMIRSDIGHIAYAFTPMIVAFLVAGPDAIAPRRYSGRLAWLAVLVIIFLSWPWAGVAGLNDLRLYATGDVSPSALWTKISTKKALPEEVLPYDLVKAAEGSNAPMLAFPYENFIPIVLGRTVVAPVLQNYGVGTLSLQDYYVRALQSFERGGLEVVYAVDGPAAWPVDGVQAIARTPAVFEFIYRNYELKINGRADSGLYLLRSMSAARETRSQNIDFQLARENRNTGEVRLTAPNTCGVVRVELRIDYPLAKVVLRPNAVAASFSNKGEGITKSYVRPIATGQYFWTDISLIKPEDFHQMFGWDAVPVKPWDVMRFSMERSGKMSVNPSAVDVRKVECIDPDRFVVDRQPPSMQNTRFQVPTSLVQGIPISGYVKTVPLSANSPWQKSARPEITVGFKGLNGHFSTL